MASACSSECNTEKSCTTGSNVSYPREKAVSESHCSSNTRCYLRRKKPSNPLALPLRPPVNSNVRQRVASAKLGKIRALQSQLNDANFHLMELAQENRALKTTQRRQDRALNTYEGVNADLPRLIKSHEEENRVLTERNRTMKRQIRELTDLLKLRDEELLGVKDQLKHLNALAKDKQLLERDELQRDLLEARELIKKYESDISVLNRKVALETKNCRQRVNAEISKYKKCQEELAQAIEEVDRQGEQQKGKLLRRRFDVSPLAGRKSTSNLLSPHGKDAKSIASPVQKIKARLKVPMDDPAANQSKTVNDILDRLDKEEQLLKRNLNGRLATTAKPTKLETLIQSRSNARRDLSYSVKATNEDAIDKTLENIQQASEECSTMNQTAKDVQSIDNNSLWEYENAVKEHFKQLKDSESELVKVREEVLEMAKVDVNANSEGCEESKFAGMLLAEEDYSLVNDIWNEEYTFRKLQREKAALDNSGVIGDGNLVKTDPIVILESKQKLLAALNEIDSVQCNDSTNGNEFGIDLQQQQKTIENESKKSRLLEELFGSG